MPVDKEKNLARGGFEHRHPTDKELPDVLAPLSLEQRIEQVIAKYVGGAMSRYYDGETDALTAERRIATELTAKIKRYALQSEEGGTSDPVVKEGQS